jgi:hypothetical protein
MIGYMFVIDSLYNVEVNSTVPNCILLLHLLSLLLLPLSAFLLEQGCLGHQHSSICSPAAASPAIRATVAPLLLLPPWLLASSAFFILPAQPLSLMIKIKNRQEKTTGQKTLLD